MSKPLLSDEKLRRETEAAQDLLSVIHESVDGDDLAALDAVEGETDLLEAIDAALRDIHDCDATIAGAKAEAERMNRRKKSAEMRKDKIRAAIERAMSIIDQKTLRRPMATLTIAERAGKLVVDNEAEIPSAYFKTPAPVLDRAALTAALADETVPGAHIGNASISLTIRSN